MRTRGLCFLLLPSILAGCYEFPVDPATQSSTVRTPYQFSIEYALEQDEDGPLTARARLYDLAQAYDWTGNAGTIELSPGDSIWAAGTELNIKTETKLLTTLRVDYSQTLDLEEERDDYLFEFRRPDDERITARIPPPRPFEVTGPDEIDDFDLDATFEWEPTGEMKSTVDIEIEPITEDCLLILGPEDTPGVIQRGVPDNGSYSWDTRAYHSAKHDCVFDIILTRRTVESVPGTWYVQGQGIPTTEIWAVGLRTTHHQVITKKRE